MAFVPLLLSLLLLSGCAGLRHTAEGWVGREPVPAEVAGLDYSRIRELGALAGACAELYEHHVQGGYVSSEHLRHQWLPRCNAQIEAARQARDALLTALVEQAWRQQQAAEARQRKAAQEALRRAAERARIHTLVQPEQPQEAGPSGQQQRLRQLARARILDVLKQVPDQPLAYAVGQPSGRSMKNFLACLEVGYPNHGYQVTQGDGTLVVVARGADIQRDRVDIRARFVSVWDTWVLEALSVAEIKATTPRERFLLAHNLLDGPSC